MMLTELTLAEAHDLIHGGSISPVEFARAYLEHITALDARLNTYISVTAELAIEQARQAESSVRAKAPNAWLCGIPLAYKDLYETRGVRTTAGSKFFAEYIPDQDAAVVERLSSAGAVMLGKLNMHEIALGVTNVNPHFGACRNPWDLERISGGSSGGSAAAVAAGLCVASLGSDTGGSIRIPASLCGVVGLKPTHGRVSLRGLIPLSWNLDHAGPLAKQVLDAAVLLQNIAGYDPGDPCSTDTPVDDYISHIQEGVGGWRIALATDAYFIERTDPQVWEAVQAAGRVFETLGAQVEAVAIPGAREAAQANGLITPSDAAAFHRERLQAQPENFGDDVRQRLQAGAAFTSTDYAIARRTQSILRRQFEQFFDRYDILLTPTTPITAPVIAGQDAIEQARLLTRFTAPFNLTGLPAISLPCGFDGRGLPVGLQIVARAWAEAQALKAAYAYEQAADWRTRRPFLEKT